MILDLGQNEISEEVLIDDKKNKILVSKYHFTFNEYKNNNSFNTYNGKIILELNGEPLFAELLILRLLEQHGYKGVWVDTFRNKFWQRLPSLSFPVLVDSKIQEMLNLIYLKKNR